MCVCSVCASNLLHYKHERKTISNNQSASHLASQPDSRLEQCIAERRAHRIRTKNKEELVSRQYFCQYIEKRPMFSFLYSSHTINGGNHIEFSFPFATTFLSISDTVFSVRSHFALHGFSVLLQLGLRLFVRFYSFFSSVVDCRVSSSPSNIDVDLITLPSPYHCRRPHRFVLIPFVIEKRAKNSREIVLVSCVAKKVQIYLKYMKCKRNQNTRYTQSKWNGRSKV